MPNHGKKKGLTIRQSLFSPIHNGEIWIDLVRDAFAYPFNNVGDLNKVLIC